MCHLRTGSGKENSLENLQSWKEKVQGLLPFKGLCYLGCLVPPNSKALNPQHIFARAPREKSPLAPPFSWAEGPAGGARGDFSRGALAKMCWSLGGLLLGGARQQR